MISHATNDARVRCSWCQNKTISAAKKKEYTCARMVAKNPRYARNVARSEQRLVIRKSAPSFAAQRQLTAKVPAASKNFKTNNARPPNHRVEKYATAPAPHSW